MNKNFELVHKSLDTITPDWQTVLVATITEKVVSSTTSLTKWKKNTSKKT